MVTVYRLSIDIPVMLKKRGMQITHSPMILTIRIPVLIHVFAYRRAVRLL